MPARKIPLISTRMLFDLLGKGWLIRGYISYVKGKPRTMYWKIIPDEPGSGPDDPRALAVSRAAVLKLRINGWIAPRAVNIHGESWHLTKEGRAVLKVWKEIRG